MDELRAFRVSVDEIAGARIAGRRLDRVEEVVDEAVRPQRGILRICADARIGVLAAAPVLRVEAWSDDQKLVPVRVFDPYIAVRVSVLAGAVQHEDDARR